MYACDSLTSERDHPTLISPHGHDQSKPKKIALVIRGHCSFSHKVRVAEARGADAVLVADDVRREGEMDEEGRERGGLLTMYSPGKSSDCVWHEAGSDALILRLQTILMTSTSRHHSSREHRSCSSGIYTGTSNPVEDCTALRSRSNRMKGTTGMRRTSYLTWDMKLIRSCHLHRPLTDVLMFVMLLPAFITIMSLLVGRYRDMR